MNINNIVFQKEFYNNNKFCVIDNILNLENAKCLQKEIIESSDVYWDRYDNPFEKKYTWRDKNNLPPTSKILFDYLHTPDFISFLSEFTNYKLLEDKSKIGDHKFNTGDKLHIPVDAGTHPKKNLKKIIQTGIYLSYNWTKECGGNIEFWDGDNSQNNDAKIYNKKNFIEPIFNRCIIFENNDYSWHGAPSPCICNKNQKRIFLTCLI